MLKKILKKIKVIIKIIINEPYSQIIIFSNFISSFLSVIGIPLLVVAYQYSESLDKNLIPFYDTLSNIFGVIGIELSFYSLIGAALFLIIFGQTCFGIVEILNRYVQIKVVKEFSINLIKNYKNANWLNILEDKSGKFQYAINTEAHRASQVVLDSLRLTSGTIQLLFFLGTSFYFSPKITTILLFFFIFWGLLLYWYL